MLDVGARCGEGGSCCFCSQRRFFLCALWSLLLSPAAPASGSRCPGVWQILLRWKDVGGSALTLSGSILSGREEEHDHDEEHEDEGAGPAMAARFMALQG